ncbi:hypothetical protein JKP88DRAFT_350710 [Tribonema minus]|uniref:Cyclic nucleotide-binding domain-containing protein n=1 Tax=Tribonema minus TaxID=303371 RepID=A0A835YLU4_9STRA|nr:hypothetical protein JKP88DRAFT_350710 [Tribonema minus]
MRHDAASSRKASPAVDPISPAFEHGRNRRDHTWWARLTAPLKPRANSLSAAMVKERVLTLPLALSTLPPLSLTTNFSNICGHGSFLMLALGYMESDVMMLRVFSAGGIVLSVLFQYYRPQPLWIPISWNTLFLLINGGMIAALISERRKADHLDDAEERAVYEEMFCKLGLSAVELMHVMRLAEQQILPAGTTIAACGQPLDKPYLITDGTVGLYLITDGTVGVTDHDGDPISSLACSSRLQSSTALYLITDGTVGVTDHDGDPIGSLTRHQFVGSMAFLRFLNTVHDHERDRDNERAVLNSLLAALAAELDPEHWEIDPDGRVVAVAAPHGEGQGGVQAGKGGVEVGKGGQQQGVAAVAAGEAAQEDEQEESEESLCISSTTVRTTTECRVFAWDFHLLRAYLKTHPLEGNAMQVTISADLTRKLDQSRDPHIRYRQLLLTALGGGEVLPCEKNKLQHYREAHGITTEEHEEMLLDLGWTRSDYTTGYQRKAITSAFAAYEDLLHQELKNGRLNEEGRARLRRFRSQSNIDATKHLLALAKLGWTYEQYEMGTQEGGSHGGVMPARLLTRKYSNLNSNSNLVMGGGGQQGAMKVSASACAPSLRSRPSTMGSASTVNS